MSKKLNMKELAEIKQLYAVFLDVSYSIEFYEYLIRDLNDNLKDAKKMLSKSKKGLKKVSDKYEYIHGKKPIIYKK